MDDKRQPQPTEHVEDCTCANCDPGRLGFKLPRSQSTPIGAANDEQPDVYNEAAKVPLRRARCVRCGGAQYINIGMGTWVRCRECKSE